MLLLVCIAVLSKRGRMAAVSFKTGLGEVPTAVVKHQT